MPFERVMGPNRHSMEHYGPRVKTFLLVFSLTKTSQIARGCQVNMAENIFSLTLLKNIGTMFSDKSRIFSQKFFAILSGLFFQSFAWIFRMVFNFTEIIKYALSYDFLVPIGNSIAQFMMW